MTGPGVPPRRTVAVVVHGAGSSAAVAAAILPAPALGVGEVIALDDRTGDVDAVAAALGRAVAAAEVDGARVRFVAGVSLGAHAVARWAAGRPDLAATVEGLLLVMPAWTGPPDHIAAVTGAAAVDLAAHGSTAVLARLRADPATADDWVVDALAAGWAAYDDTTLVAVLRQASRSPGPSWQDLAAISLPCGLVALDDDPLHPADVAQGWARTIPRAAVAIVGRHDPHRDGPACLGQAAVAAWLQAERGQGD